MSPNFLNCLIIVCIAASVEAELWNSSVCSLVPRTLCTDPSSVFLFFFLLARLVLTLYSWTNNQPAPCRQTRTVKCRANKVNQALVAAQIAFCLKGHMRVNIFKYMKCISALINGRSLKDILNLPWQGSDGNLQT